MTNPSTEDKILRVKDMKVGDVFKVYNRLCTIEELPGGLVIKSLEDGWMGWPKKCGQEPVRRVEMPRTVAELYEFVRTYQEHTVVNYD